MNEKLLWKIEELWNTHFKDNKNSDINVTKNYKNSISKYYKKFHLVENFDFTESKDSVFSDDYGSYKGLQKLQVSMNSGKPVYLVDNHNEMVYPLLEITSQAGNDIPFDVVHIDAHPDDAKFQGKKPTNLSLGEVGEFIKKTRISDFFDAISDVSLRGTKQSQKLVGTIFRVCHSDNFEFFLPPEKPYILSLDIDIFGPEGDFVDLKDKVRAIALAWSGAEAVCIATSPGFIDQEYAKKIISIMTK